MKSLNVYLMGSALALSSLSTGLFAQSAVPGDIYDRGAEWYKEYSAAMKSGKTDSRIHRWAAEVAKSSDVVSKLNEMSAKYNSVAEPWLKDRGLVFKFENAASDFDKMLFYMDIVENRKMLAGLDLDKSKMKETFVSVSPEQIEQRDALFGGALKAAYAEKSASAEIKKFAKADKEFSLPLSKNDNGNFDYDNVEIDASYAMKDGKTILTIDVRKSLDNVYPSEAGEHHPNSDNTEFKYKWDQRQVNAAAGGGFAGFKTILTKKLTYELKDSAELEKFKKLVPAGKFTLSGQGGDAWSSTSSEIKLKVPAVQQSVGGASAITLVDSNTDVHEKSSGLELTADQIKNARYLGINAKFSSLYELAKQLKKLKLASGESMSPIDELKLDLIPRVSCKHA